MEDCGAAAQWYSFLCFHRDVFFLFLAPTFTSTHFSLDATSSDVFASWVIADDCRAVTDIVVSGHNQNDTSEWAVMVTVGATDTSAWMTASKFTKFDNYLFDVTAFHTAVGQAVTSDLSTTQLIPNKPCRSYWFCLIVCLLSLPEAIHTCYPICWVCNF